MKPIQGKIIIANGKFCSIEHSEYEVIVQSEDLNLDIRNAWIYPGFCDSHGHILSLGEQLSGLNFNHAKSVDECIELALKHNKYRGEWLVGRGWNQELWDKKDFPKAKMLDEYFSEVPVYLERVDGHASWVNSKALKITGISRNSTDPSGGAILKDKSGNPTGILLDNAMELVKSKIPRREVSHLMDSIKKAINELISNGILYVHDMDVAPELIPIFKDLDNSNQLPIKINAYVCAQKDEWLHRGIKPYSGKNFNVCGIKLYADGALGSRGAALLRSYSDDKGNKGLLLLSEKEMYEKCRLGIENGFQIAIHAIGSLANRTVLRTYAKLYDDKIADRSSLLRLEHAQIIHPSDLHYFAKYKIIPSIQPVHCISDAPMAKKRLKSRCSYSYPWKSLINHGANLLSGSDFPIESHNPIIGIDALVRRVPFGRTESWYPKEIIDVKQALDSYTQNPIKYFGSQNKGKLSEGESADFVIMNNNLISCDKAQILQTNVLAAFSEGRCRYLSPTLTTK